MAISLDKTKRNLLTGFFINIFVSILSLVFLGILWLYLITPLTIKSKELNVKLNSISRIDKNEIPNLVSTKDSLNKEKNKLNKNLAISRSKLSLKKDISTLLDKFILTAKKRNLEFTYIKPLPKQETILENEGTKLVIKETPILIELESGFSEFIQFLWDIEHSDELFKIKKLTIEINPKNAFRHKQSLTLSVYQLLDLEQDYESNNN